ncbi:hypothetical protein BDN70DRAFT_888466 [Pholiota conissans]|uniref:F-box domain-containing protein n=1 Tax=Pholiota conissans TaxID=109636 RepID=A0A9P5YP31_9AGAR|nr:hypothetical protein BDN70DRAFT_888466 [Pholiota conissans]
MSSIPIPPELFPHIAAFLPLRAAGPTLLSLSLTNHAIHHLVYPLLYSRLILRNEDSALSAMQKILDVPQLGIAVTELHVMTELSSEARKGTKPFDVVEGLQRMVEGNLLPRLIALGLYLTDGWVFDEEYNPILTHGRISVDFWRYLRVACPRLKSLSLQNLGHSFDDPWFSGPVLDEVLQFQGLSTLRLEWIDQMGLSDTDSLRVINSLPKLASSLHSLSLQAGDLQNLDEFFLVDFPNLKWLRLQDFDAGSDPSSLMTFLRRHTQLESFTFMHPGAESFGDDVEGDFLPNLKHLKASFRDIRRWTPVLPQLISLSVTESYNCQVPYLLRAILPEGLPGLKSLEIRQQSAGWELRTFEGVLWYETPDGQFRKETRRKKMPRDFTNEYIHSIITGAPNVEELALHGLPMDPKQLKKIGPFLAQFKKLKRFYYDGFSKLNIYGNRAPIEDHEELLAYFLSSAEMLARICGRLERVTSIGARFLPYISCIVDRDSDGSVVGVRRNDHFGMEIPSEENDPFPSAKLS